MQKAFGKIDGLWPYDKETTDLLMGRARRAQPIEPRYRLAVYFGQQRGVWMSIVDAIEATARLPADSKSRARVWRDVAIFLNRHDSLSRSDCETKWSLLDKRSFRCYDGQGRLVTEGNIVDQLTVVIDTDGHTQRNYLYPKDPRRKGKWGDTVVVDPLRTSILVNEKVPWRSTAVRVGYLCSVRALRGYYQCLQAMGLLDKLPEMKVWTAVHQITPDGKLLPLVPATIASLVKKRAGEGGLRVGTSDTPTARDVTKPGDHEDILAGHFLRGHAASVAYTLATQWGAGWDPMLGIDRARHTLAVFLKSYSRGVAPQLIAAFREFPGAQRLRFEEASRL